MFMAVSQSVTWISHNLLTHLPLNISGFFFSFCCCCCCYHGAMNALGHVSWYISTRVSWGRAPRDGIAGNANAELYRGTNCLTFPGNAHICHNGITGYGNVHFRKARSLKWLYQPTCPPAAHSCPCACPHHQAAGQGSLMSARLVGVKWRFLSILIYVSSIINEVEHLCPFLAFLHEIIWPFLSWVTCFSLLCMCLSVCKCVYVYAHMHTYKWIRVFMSWVYMYVYAYIWVYMCVCLCAHTCVCVYMTKTLVIWIIDIFPVYGLSFHFLYGVIDRHS